ncbi:MAG: alpha-ketoacid dehydrogenase subunit beta [Candidatus Hodarchaeales archaeon]|jgi:2-oxoisovalerate dehydrogenase E1 component beta subunit
MPEITMVEAVRLALDEEMERNDRLILLGEDIGANGGVFRATQGLIDKYGPERVLDTPLAESGIIGFAIGLALHGLRPVAEIQFIDFVWPGFDQIHSELSKFRYRSGGMFPVPVVMRSPYGGGVRGAHYHSQSPETYFTHTPGLKVVIPSNPYDTKGLLTAAMRDPDPIIFLEPKRLYRAFKEEVPEGEYTVPIGKANTARIGKDLTILSFGSMLHVSLEAAELASERYGIDCEVIDLRTLMPLDIESIEASVKKTGRVISVTEAPKTTGFGAELSALVAERWIEYMEGPILRVAGYDTPFPFTLEQDYLPTTNRVLDAVTKVYNF